MPQQHGPHCQTTETPVFYPKKVSAQYRRGGQHRYQRQVIGLMPLHIKAKMQSTLIRIGRLGRNCDYEGIHFDHESYEQPSPPSTIHPALFSLEDRISHGGQVPSKRTPIEVYTDGS
ncbi:hypothetical protein AVEN_219782-1 [Araneus ventricosus]|uniref:Uncharacterized protein n=1 Tax=Araneus ventricosus TaxID=182803 RepID=A0A4Y2VA48_ARAVE|nr:hypothetical protein AVEN_219782-1 [Araneus ventricosus]